MRAGCFTLIVYMISCDCYCSVVLPSGAMGLSAVVIVLFPDHTHIRFYYDIRGTTGTTMKYQNTSVWSKGVCTLKYTRSAHYMLCL